MMLLIPMRLRALLFLVIVVVIATIAVTDKGSAKTPPSPPCTTGRVYP